MILAALTAVQSVGWRYGILMSDNVRCPIMSDQQRVVNLFLRQKLDIKFMAFFKNKIKCVNNSPTSLPWLVQLFLKRNKFLHRKFNKLFQHPLVRILSILQYISDNFYFGSEVDIQNSNSS